MSESLKQSIFSALRTLLGFGAGLLVARGIISETEALELVGAAMVLLPLAWGVLNKIQAEGKTQARENEAVKATVAAAKDSAVPKTITPAASQAIIKEYAP